MTRKPSFISTLDVPTVPWSKGPMPDATKYTEAELFVAGALSTMPPFSGEHPAHALPYARRALEALSDWEPSDATSPMCVDCGEYHGDAGRGYLCQAAQVAQSQDYIDTANGVLG